MKGHSRTGKNAPADTDARRACAGNDPAGEPLAHGTAESFDALCNGRLRLVQSRSGYRSSLDAILLAGFAMPYADDRVADLGSGNGIVAILLAAANPAISVTGVEIQRSLVERARRNVDLNALGGRVDIVHADVRAVREIAPPESFAAVVCNPPYRKAESGRLNPDTERQIARHETMGTLADFLAAGKYLLAAKGTMTIVYPALRMVDLLSGMRDSGVEPKRLRLVHSFAGTQASLVLAQGRRGGKPGAAVMAPLVIYEREGKYTREVDLMLQGEQ